MTQCIIFFDTEGSFSVLDVFWRVDRLSTAMKRTETEIWDCLLIALGNRSARPAEIFTDLLPRMSV